MKEYVPDFTVRPGLWGDETKTGEVGQKRHTVLFPDRDGQETLLTFCNNCGSAFTMCGKCSECGH